MNFEVVILSQDESKISTVKSLLSKYYTLKITFVCHHSAEAVDYLNNHRPSLFFLDLGFAEVLHDILKPPFIVGLCDQMNTKKVKQLLGMGFFDIFFAPFTEREMNSIMGKIMNIYGRYNKIDRRTIQRVEEEVAVYNAENSSAKSVFIRGTRNEESVRIIFDKVLYIKKIGNQICVYFEDGDKKYFTSNLKLFRSKFPKTRFLKINRSVVVNMDKVTGVMKNHRILISDNAIFTISRSFRKPFKQLLPD